MGKCFVFPQFSTENPGVETIQTAKIGRPNADNPKTNRFSIRLDNYTLEQLDLYCVDTGVKRAEAIRRGIALLLESEHK